MYKSIQFEHVKKIALSNIELIAQHVCKDNKATLVAIKHYLETGEALRTQAIGCHNVKNKFTEMLEAFIRGLDVRCIDELIELIPEGMDDRLPRWLYGPVEARLGEVGWEISPAVLN